MSLSASLSPESGNREMLGRSQRPMMQQTEFMGIAERGGTEPMIRLFQTAVTLRRKTRLHHAIRLYGTDRNNC